MKKKAFALLLALAVLVAVLAACGSTPPASGTDAGPASGGSTSGTVGTGDVKLTFLNVFPMDETNAHYEKYLEEYTRQNPNVTIEYTTVPWDAPFIFVKVLGDLPNEYVFVNRTDVGGRYLEKWTYDKDAWVTIVYKTPEAKGKLPKTGV